MPIEECQFATDIDSWFLGAALLQLAPACKGMFSLPVYLSLSPASCINLFAGCITHIQMHNTQRLMQEVGERDR